MITIPISAKDIEWAKQKTIEFDAQKTHNKYDCEHNYFGILGEKILNDWLNKYNVPHEWVDFIKTDYNSPDFIINDFSIDLKTTIGTALIVSKIQFDYYIFSRVNEDVKELFLISFISGDRLRKLIDQNKCNILQKENGINYLCPIDKMSPITELFNELFKDKDKWTGLLKETAIY